MKHFRMILFIFIISSFMAININAQYAPSDFTISASGTVTIPWNQNSTNVQINFSYFGYGAVRATLDWVDCTNQTRQTPGALPPYVNFTISQPGTYTATAQLTYEYPAGYFHYQQHSVTFTVVKQPTPIYSVTIIPFTPGGMITVDGTLYTSSTTFSWLANSTHTITCNNKIVVNNPCGPGLCYYYFTRWSDGNTSYSRTYTVTQNNASLVPSYRFDCPCNEP